MKAKAKKYKFNKDQQKWLKALESGEYAQTKALLCNGDGFCCLGVACDVLGAKFEEPGVGATAFRFGREREATVLPETIRKRLKLRTVSGGLRGRFRIGQAKCAEELTEANDNGAKFSSIAKFIRANPEAVFTDAK